MVEEKDFKIVIRDGKGRKLDLYENEPGREHPQIINFPAGEILVRCPFCYDSVEINITVHDRTMDGLFVLAQIVDIYRHADPQIEVYVNIPYFPNARQDRRTQDGESFSLKVYADYLNSLQVDRVVSCDPHSDVVAAVVNNFHPIEQSEIWEDWLIDYINQGDPDTHFVFVVPDAGAFKKTEKIYGIVKQCVKRHVVLHTGASKKRDPITGRLTIAFEGDLSDCDVVIVDDICDGGGTFLGLAEEINVNASRGYCSLTLAVTHGLFTKGTEAFKKHFTHLAEMRFVDRPEIVVTDLLSE